MILSAMRDIVITPLGVAQYGTALMPTIIGFCWPLILLLDAAAAALLITPYAAIIDYYASICSY